MTSAPAPLPFGDAVHGEPSRRAAPPQSLGAEPSGRDGSGPSPDTGAGMTPDRSDHDEEPGVPFPIAGGVSKPLRRKGGVKLAPPPPDAILDAKLRIGVAARFVLTAVIAAAAYVMCGIVETGTLLPVFLATWGALCFFFGPYLAPPEARKAGFRRRYLTFGNLWRAAGIFSWILAAIALIYLTYN